MTCHSVKTIEKFFGLCDWLIQTYEFRKYLFDDNPDIGYLKQARYEHFFYRLHNLLQESWMHQLARLHDPAIQGKSINLTLEYIVEYVGWEREFKAELNEVKKKLDKFYPSIKIARNKLLSHNDLKTIVSNDESESLGQFDEGQDIEYFESLKQFCEKVSQKTLNAPFIYDDLVKNDVEVFLSKFMS